ncbi:c-type cytochrome biogenesis protein CcmI [Paracoccus alkenifer]|uniref:Cytochrome c-type biogenesis protein CcmH n=1 Tax=Paracoccus alkenifer TaxID=65735 RepID=A0A1H6LEF6_9RHOB|nr:c-type cytochrome biogenesis protein CcmI [Paracoccus alkenifer]SEH84537.1 cytochrome c-type biogenesis protein CcmH [Paracoccus alkenifer]
MFWIILAAMTLVVAGAILRPFIGGGQAEAIPAAAYDLGVYRDQLREVDRDVKRGVLTEAEAARLRTEIGRKILDADRALTRHSAGAERPARPWLAVAVLVLAVAASAAIYLRNGSPAMPDVPLKARIAAADARIADLPAQADLVARAPARELPQADPDYLQLIERLRQAVIQQPDDRQGLELLAEHEARLGNVAAAADAQARLLALRGEDAGAFDHVRLALLWVDAAGGMVSAEAQAQLATALRLDPQLPQARYLLGLMYAQNDRPDLAFDLWRELLENSRPDAPWNLTIRQMIPELAWFAGHPGYRPPETGAPGMPALPGPDAETMAAAGEMSPEEQQQMIRGMVDNLESRLATEGGTPEEWARLITSLVRVDDRAHAQEILAEARMRFGNAPEAAAVINAAAAEVGLDAAE